MLKFNIQLSTPPNRPLIFRNAGNEKKNIVGHRSKHAHLLLARTWKYSTQSMHHSKTLADEKRDQFLTWLTQSLKTHRDATPGSYLHWVGVRATRTPEFYWPAGWWDQSSATAGRSIENHIWRHHTHIESLFDAYPKALQLLMHTTYPSPSSEAAARR